MTRVKIYKDLEHQKQLELEESLKKSPAERIAEVVALIKKIYPIKISGGKKRIHFRKK